MKIYGFGCSFTEGQGFPDNPGTGNGTPSKYAWPAQLQKLTGIEAVNHGHGGASILQIAEIFCSKFHEIEPGDIVIIEWTYFNRWTVFDEHPQEKTYPHCKNLIPAMRTPQQLEKYIQSGLPDWEDYLRKYSNDIHQVFMYCMLSQMVDAMCKAKGVTYMPKILDLFDYQHVKKYQPDWYQVDKPKYSLTAFYRDGVKSMIKNYFDLEIGKLPDNHYNEAVHIMWARTMLRELQIKGVL
jgi:hypothetical protein